VTDPVTRPATDLAAAPAAPLRILTVCSHNRTRSVMMAALLDQLLTERLGAGGVVVRSSGFGPPGLPAIDDAVRAMRRRGLDVSHHRSTATTPALVDGADLIITAERDHVVKIASLSPAAFRRSLTLPEFLERAAVDPAARNDGGVRTWVESLTAGRTAAGYLRDRIPEVADPTGSSPRVFEAATAEIERQCAEVSVLLTGRP
jgi:protein-tyrosine-phosphatase